MLPYCPFIRLFLLASCLFCAHRALPQLPGQRQPPSPEELRQIKIRLETELKTAGADTAKVRIKMQLAGLVSAENPGEGLKLAQEALALAEKTGHTETTARSYFGLGTIHYRSNRHDQALEYLNKGLPLAEKTGKADLQEAYYSSLAQIYFNRGVYEKSLDYYRKSLALLERIQAPPARQAVALIQIGHLLERTGKNREAIETGKKALVFLEQAQDWDKAGAVWRNIGDNYQALGETGLAEQAFAKSRELQERSKKKASTPANGKSGSN